MTETAKVVAGDPESNTSFGGEVDLEGDLLAVGMPRAIPGLIIILPGDPGAVYLYERNEGGPGNWGQVKKVVAADSPGLDNFGAGYSSIADLARMANC